MEKVFNFSGWKGISRHLGISKATTRKLDGLRGEPIPPPNQAKFSGGPESALHRKLKDWLADHPEAVSAFGQFKEGGIECRPRSGGRPECLFKDGQHPLAGGEK